MKKKVLLSVMILGALVTVTGCGKKDDNKSNENTTTTAAATKKLTCTMEETEKKSTETIKYVFNFKDTVYDKVSVIDTIKFTSGKYDEKTATDAEKECASALKHKGITCNVSKSGASIYITYQFTIEQMDDETKKLYKEAGLEELDGKTYEEIKSTLTAATFTCN